MVKLNLMGSNLLGFCNDSCQGCHVMSRCHVTWARAGNNKPRPGSQLSSTILPCTMYYAPVLQSYKAVISAINVSEDNEHWIMAGCGLDHVSRIIKIFTQPGSLRHNRLPPSLNLAEYWINITGSLSYHSGCPVVWATQLARFELFV